MCNQILSAYYCDKRTVHLMHEITLIFDVFQRAYYLRLVLQFQFLITFRARLEISHFFRNFLVRVNDSFLSMITIIKHIKGEELSFFSFKSLRVRNQCANFGLPFSWFYCIEDFFFLKHLSLRMDLMCRGR